VEGPAVTSSASSNLNGSVTLPFVIPSEAEGSAVRPSASRNFPYSNLTPKQNCHPDRSEAQWRDLQLIIHSRESEWKRRPPLCHPDRSVPDFLPRCTRQGRVCAFL